MPNVVDVRNIGPISHVRFEVPDKGLLLLEGPNGSGKTTLIELLQCLQQGSSLNDFTVRDGELSGSAQAFGLTVSHGHGRKKAGVDGECTVPSLSKGIDPSILVDPGLKGAEANDARRMAMLCRMAGVQPNIELFAAVVPDLKLVATDAVLASESVPEMADKLRRGLHERALALEKEGEVLERRAATLALTVEGVKLDVPSAEEARARLNELTQERATAIAQANAYAKAKRAAENAQAIIERAGTVAIEDLERTLAEARKTVKGAGELVATAQQALARAQSNLDTARAAQDTAERAEVEATKKLDDARATHAQVEQARAAMRELDELENPNAEDLARLERAHAEATNAVVLAGDADRARQTLAQSESVRKEAKAKADSAESLRSQAHATENVVAEAISRIAPMGLHVEGGRLVTKTARGKTLWDDLSHGERWTIALECAIGAVGTGGVLSIRQEACEALDPENLHAIAQRAWDAGVCIVTARAAGGELTARVYQPGVSDPAELARDASRN